MNQYYSQQAPGWNGYQHAGQPVPPMQQWQQAPAHQYQGYGQQAGGNQQSYQQIPQQWPAKNTTTARQIYQQQMQADGFGNAGFDFSIGGLLFAIFVACFLVWFGWRRKIRAVDEPAGPPITRNDRRMLVLAEELNKLCNKT